MAIDLKSVFFLVGLIGSITKLEIRLKMFLIVEPFISVVLTFGGLYLLWTGILWMKYLVMFSGILMTLTFTASVLIIIRQLLQKK